MPSLITLTPSGDKTGATDTAAINGALTGGEGTTVFLEPGDYYTNGALAMGKATELAGTRGGMNGTSATSPHGSVIRPVAAFAGTEVISLANGTGACKIRDLAIANSLGTPAGVDGIACRGNIDALWIRGMSIYAVTGHGLAYYQAGGVDGDALWMERCMFQRCGLNAIHRPPNDSNITDIHIQYAGQAGDPGYNNGIYSTPGMSGNMCYTACRVDLCVGSGWVIDHKGSYGDATKLTGCSTERNGHHGVEIINSSAGGSDWRSPVIISGCCFEGDGSGIGPGGRAPGPGGEYAGIAVQGANRVFVDGTVTAVNTTDVPAGCPKYALSIRSSGGANVESIVWSGGRMNYSTGQGGQAILNHSLCYNLQISPETQSAGGYEDTTPDNRTGKATLTGTSVTVSTPWAWPSMLIGLTPLGSPAGRLYVRSRSNGSFVISSTASESGLAVAWQIIPGQ